MEKVILTYDELIEMYDTMIDECNESMFGFYPSDILREMDPIQYDCGLNDFYDSLTYDGYYCEVME